MTSYQMFYCIIEIIPCCNCLPSSIVQYSKGVLCKHHFVCVPLGVVQVQYGIQLLDFETTKKANLVQVTDTYRLIPPSSFGSQSSNI